MFDFMTRRRIIYSLIVILFVTISILFLTRLHSTFIRRVIPSYYTSSLSNISTNTEQQTNNCDPSEPIDIIAVCHKCTSFEQRSKATGCSPTGYKEFVLCSKSNIKIYRSCPLPIAIQKLHFWFFECFICLIGLIAVTGVHLRQKALDKQMVEKIKRQIEENEE